MKPFKILLLSVCVGLQGCVASSYIQDNLLGSDFEYAKTLDKDKIIAIGTAAKTQNGNAELLFIGEKYTYMMHQGGDELMQLIQHIPAEDRILTSKLPIKFFLSDENNFNGLLQFRHSTPINALSPTQLDQLRKLGFNRQTKFKNTQGQVMYYPLASFGFAGKLHQSIEPQNIQHKMSQAYPIQLTQIVSRNKENKSGKSLAGLVLMPLAIGVDVITLPVAIGAVGYGLTHKEIN